MFITQSIKARCMMYVICIITSRFVSVINYIYYVKRTTGRD